MFGVARTSVGDKIRNSKLGVALPQLLGAAQAPFYPNGAEILKGALEGATRVKPEWLQKKERTGEFRAPTEFGGVKSTLFYGVEPLSNEGFGRLDQVESWVGFPPLSHFCLRFRHGSIATAHADR